jgi:hypothetical protein
MRLKTTSKEKQKDFIDSVKPLLEDPRKLIPECLDPGLFCPFSGYQKKLGKGDNLSRYARSSDQLLSAIAETEKAIEAETLPFLGMVKTPLGTIEYAKRGDTDPLVLAGVQHFSDPVWRMLAFSSLSMSKGARVYSTRDIYLGSCKNSSPGIDFFQSALRDESISFTLSDGAIIVGSAPHFTIEHLGETSIKIGSDSTYNTIHSIMKHVLTPDFSADFKFSMDYLQDVTAEFPSKASESYLSGKMNDRTFYRETSDFRLSMAISQGCIVIGEKVYTTGRAFVESNEFSYVPGEIIAEFLEEIHKGLYMDVYSERKVLEAIWPQCGEKILRRIFPDRDPTSFSALKGSPIEQIEYLAGESRVSEFVSRLNLKPWSSDASFLLQMLGDMATSGKQRAIREGEKMLGASMNRRAIFYAFLMSVGEASNREWQFSQNEKELSFKIAHLIDGMIKATPENLPGLFYELRSYIG